MFKKELGERIKGLREGRGLSQQQLANKIGINRVSLSQIENGQRDVSAEELSKISKFFNVRTDVLLNLQKDIKIILEKTAELASRNKKEEIRVSVPQQNLAKFKEVLLYVLEKVGSKANVGETVIYKLLYFIDFDYYEKFEEQLIGATYIKNHHGPTPVEFIKIVEKMKDEEDIAQVEDQYFQYPQTKYLPRRKADLGILNANEKMVIDEVLDRLSDMNATQISRYSHEDVPWKTTEEGQQIDYEAVFYRTPAYSVRSYSEEEGEDI